MPDSTPDTSTWPTRRQVAERFGISTSSVRRMEWDKLHPRLGDDGVYRFDPAEVDAIRKPRQRAAPRTRDPALEERAKRGRLAARVFRMFARDMTLRQIVVATNEPPEVIRGLFHEWQTDLYAGEQEGRG